jgi:hypothetical protein
VDDKTTKEINRSDVKMAQNFEHEQIREIRTRTQIKKKCMKIKEVLW